MQGSLEGISAAGHAGTGLCSSTRQVAVCASLECKRSSLTFISRIDYPPMSGRVGVASVASSSHQLCLRTSSQRLRPRAEWGCLLSQRPALATSLSTSKFLVRIQHNSLSDYGLMNPRQRREYALQSRAGDGEAELEVNAGEKDVSMEKGVLANEELLLFFYQLDLTTRLQKVLNLDQYEPAKQLRERIAEVEREVARQREARMGASSKDEAHDMGLAILRVKADMQSAIKDERYTEAAALRDTLSKLEADALAASLAGLATKNVTYEYRLGQKIRHKVFGYRGVICGFDPVCCESEEWAAKAQVSRLERGRNQPFYQVLVDIQELAGFLVAYVPEERILAPPELDKEPFNHPYTYLLFYGQDGNGDFVPTKQLREKYDAPRHELPYGEDDEENGG